jgi:hypothetical protein
MMVQRKTSGMQLQQCVQKRQKPWLLSGLLNPSENITVFKGKDLRTDPKNVRLNTTHS